MSCATTTVRRYVYFKHEPGGARPAKPISTYRTEEKMVDPYTKVVLTIIAACLTVIAAKDLSFMRTAVAQGFGQPLFGQQATQQANHVVVDGFGETAFQYAFQSVSQPLPVKMAR
jgi:hypothetical protein